VRESKQENQGLFALALGHWQSNKIEQTTMYAYLKSPGSKGKEYRRRTILVDIRLPL
jgi:hypothetical protein